MRITMDFLVDFAGIEDKDEEYILPHVLLAVKDAVNEKGEITIGGCTIMQMELSRDKNIVPFKVAILAAFLF